MMTFANQVEYLISLINWAFSSLSTSSLIALCHFSPIFLLFHETGLARGHTVSLQHMMLGWIPDMSDGCHANRCMFLRKTSTIRLYSWLVRSLLSYVHCPGLGSSCSLTSSSISFGPLSTVSSHGSTSKASSRLAS